MGVFFFFFCGGLAGPCASEVMATTVRGRVRLPRFERRYCYNGLSLQVGR